MSFDTIAKSLLSQATRPPIKRSDLDVLAELEAAGFSRSELLHEYRNLFETTEDDSIKHRVLKDIAQIHQLMNKEEGNKITPNITINVFGDNTRVAAMLCPLEAENAA